MHSQSFILIAQFRREAQRETFEYPLYTFPHHVSCDTTLDIRPLKAVAASHNRPEAAMLVVSNVDIAYGAGIGK